MNDQEADIFAAHLLMPSQWMQQHFCRMLTENGTKTMDDIITDMAKLFDVEPTRMTARLIEMKLIDNQLRPTERATL